MQPDGFAPPPPAINGGDGHGASNVQGALEPRGPESAAPPSASTNGGRASRSHTPAVRTRPAENFVKLGEQFFFL